MSFTFSKPLFIDSCAIGLLADPLLMRFWQKFQKGLKHCICHVVYWEYMRGFGPRTHRRPNEKQFRNWVVNQAEVLTFGMKAADHATAIYKALLAKWVNLPKEERRIKVLRLHADIIIAAVAVEHGLQVLTDDIEDWSDIWAVIREKRIDPLGGFAVIDPRDLPR